LFLGFFVISVPKIKLTWGQKTHRKSEYNRWAAKDIGVNG